MRIWSHQQIQRCNIWLRLIWSLLCGTSSFSFDLLKHQSSTQMALKLLTSTLSQRKCRSSVLCQGERSREKVLRLQIRWRRPQCGGAVAARMALSRGRLEVGDWKGLEMFGQKEAFHCMCRQPRVHDGRGHWWDKRLITNFPASNSDCAKKWSLPIFVFYCVTHKYVRKACWVWIAPYKLDLKVTHSGFLWFLYPNTHTVSSAGGYAAGSLAIMTDAAHLLTDFVSIVISIFSLWIASRPQTGTMTFGWYRAGRNKFLTSSSQEYTHQPLC